MDLKIYYQKIRETEAAIEEDFPIIVGQESPNGGAGATPTEVRKSLAAKLVVEGVARLATATEAKAFRDSQAEARRAAELAAAAAKVQLTVVTAAELEKLKGASKPKA